MSMDGVVLGEPSVSWIPAPEIASGAGGVGSGAGVDAGNRLRIPGGGVAPAANFRAMPGGRSSPRRNRPGGTSLDFPDAGICGETGVVPEICMCKLPFHARLYRCMANGTLMTGRLQLQLLPAVGSCS